MDDIIREVRDIEAGDRKALEHMLGLRLQEHQKIIISVLNGEVRPQAEAVSPSLIDGLPSYCNVYEGLSDEEIADIETSIVRSPDSRSFE